MAFELPGNIEVIGAFYQANALMVSDEESRKLEINALEGKAAFNELEGLRERLLGDRPDIQGFFMDGKKPLFRIRTRGDDRPGLLKIMTEDVDPTRSYPLYPSPEPKHILVYEQFWKAVVAEASSDDFDECLVGFSVESTELASGVVRTLLNVTYDDEDLELQSKQDGFSGLTLVKANGSIVELKEYE